MFHNLATHSMYIFCNWKCIKVFFSNFMENLVIISPLVQVEASNGSKDLKKNLTCTEVQTALPLKYEHFRLKYIYNFLLIFSTFLDFASVENELLKFIIPYIWIRALVKPRTWIFYTKLPQNGFLLILSLQHVLFRYNVIIQRFPKFFSALKNTRQV